MKRNAVTYDLGEETEETNTLELKLNTHVAGDFRGLDYEIRGAGSVSVYQSARAASVESELAL